jgi:hypothetical protein
MVSWLLATEKTLLCNPRIEPVQLKDWGLDRRYSIRLEQIASDMRKSETLTWQPAQRAVIIVCAA